MTGENARSDQNHAPLVGSVLPPSDHSRCLSPVNVKQIFWKKRLNPNLFAPLNP